MTSDGAMGHRLRTLSEEVAPRARFQRTARRGGLFLYISPVEMASFVRRDWESLTSRFFMKRQFYAGKARGIFDILSIFRGILASGFSVSWFGYHQAYWAVRFSRLLGRKSIVILGGFDVCEEEDPHFAGRVNEIRYVLQHANRLLAVSKRVRDKARLITSDGPPIEVLYHGFDSRLFRPDGAKLDLAVTIGYFDESNAKRKGVAAFVETARLLPDVRFAVIGESLGGALETLRSSAPPNVTFTGKLPEPQLIAYLQRAKVYVQASLHEGFGCSLAEAMLCECVPVVSRRGAIPEVVGDCGVYVDPKDVEDIAVGIRKALANPAMGGLSRERISKLFPVEARRDRLIGVVHELMA